MFLIYWLLFVFFFTHADALLADLENTGSPLARCPVLLTSDPPKNSDAAAEDPAQTRPPPPAYTPQQVGRERPGMFLDGISGLELCSLVTIFVDLLLLLSDSFCCHENIPEFQPRQAVQVSRWS